MTAQDGTRADVVERGAGTGQFLVGLARASGGAIFFALPLLMTMEMWWLGFYMDRVRLALFILAMIPVLTGLSHYSGFEQTPTWLNDAVDAFVAYAVAFVTATLVLLLLNIIDLSMPLREITGKIALQAVPASFGAVLAGSQFGPMRQEDAERRKQEAGYGAELFFMLAGALFLSFTVAPTEEMILIAFRMTEWHAITLAIASLAMMHAFVYAVDFRGEHRIPEGTPWWYMVVRFTVVGYAISLVVSTYVLWTFGHYTEGAMSIDVIQTIVLAFPASLGAAAARLIL